MLKDKKKKKEKETLNQHRKIGIKWLHKSSFDHGFGIQTINCSEFIRSANRELLTRVRSVQNRNHMIEINPDFRYITPRQPIEHIRGFWLLDSFEEIS
jgi:hypothetical protein